MVSLNSLRINIFFHFQVVL